MKRFLINVTTAWCGMDQTYAAFANDDADLENTAEMLAYDNHNDFNNYSTILDELFPDAKDYTNEMREEADKVEYEYYGYTVDEWDETRPEEQWERYELVYDAREVEEGVEVGEEDDAEV